MLKPKKILEKIPVYQTDEYFENYDLKLDSNENLYDVSPKVLEVLSNVCKKDISFYPCYGELLDKLAKEHFVDKNNILLTNGCDEAISVVFSTYLEKGDKVVSFAPTFAMPKIYANVNGAKFIEVDYKQKWVFDVQEIVKNIDNKTKIIHLTSPNSPTGENIELHEIEYILENYQDKLVVLDVTYGSFVERGQDFFGLIKEYPNLVIVKSFSKDYALAGLRLGYIVTNKKNIENIKKVISPYSVNTYAVKAGIAVLDDKKYLNDMKAEIISSRKLLINGLSKLGFSAYDSETNFVLCDFKNYSSFAYKKLLTNSIKVKNFGNKKNLENCFRISVPKVSDTKKILNALSSKTLLVFDLDGVVFDVQNSYRLAIEKTFEFFTGKKLLKGEIQEAKNLGGLNCDWDLTEFLLKKYGVNRKKAEIIEVFQQYFFNEKNEGSKGLIDNEKLLLDKLGFEKLSKIYDLCVFTGRPRNEAIYSLQKFGILKYFNIIVAKEDLPKNKQKPHPEGLNYIIKNSYFKDIYYLGDTGDDMLCAKSAGVNAIGVLPPNEQNDIYKNHLIKSGASVVIQNIGDILKVNEGQK
ncbi:MAG: histidinol-phosphate transaminase [Cyanobacteria bacterium SIG30]|nr:histidinol-phosphate transaminase [Cyanobacteria bacterium SIG30]